MNKPNSRSRTLPVSPNLKTEGIDDTTVIRVRFSRKGATAFVAHLDMMRIFERAMKRAGIDCEYSQGFNPRPQMAFALPLGVGVETIDDYVDITIRTKIAPVELVLRLNRAVPSGIEIIGAVPAPKEKESMMAQVVAAQYFLLGPDISAILPIIEKKETLPVVKTSKGQSRTIDIKPLILNVEAQDANSVKIMVKAGSKENLRPDLFLEAMVDAGCLAGSEARNTQIIRIGTFILSSDKKLIRPI